MRIAFLGTPEFAVPCLNRVVEAGYDIVAVVTQPDRPKGRGKKLTPPAVKVRAIELGLEVHQPPKIKPSEVVEWFRGLNVEAMAVVAYGKIIPQSIIDIPRLGLVNVHGSLLPKYRGAAPIEWAVIEGETETGVTTMLIDAGLDSGDMLLKQETEIGPDETAVEVRERLSLLGADLLVQTLRGLERGSISPVPQDHELATMAPMLKKETGRIDWSWSARTIHNRVRGLQPWPGAYTCFRGQPLHIWRSRIAEQGAAGIPGTLRAAKRRAAVVCGDGSVLELVEVQMQGRNRIAVDAFINGQRLQDGERFGGEDE